MIIICGYESHEDVVPHQGSEPVPHEVEVRVLSTGPQSLSILFFDDIKVHHLKFFIKFLFTYFSTKLLIS